MKKLLSLLGVLAMALLVACSSENGGANEPSPSGEDMGESEGRPIVYSSFFPIYDLTSKIGGQMIDSRQLIPDGVAAHDYDPSSQDMVMLEEADMLVINGANMEGWADSLVASLSNDIYLCDSSEGISLIEGHSHDHDHGHEEDDHDHSLDPHTWTSPRNAMTQAQNIKDALAEIDPENEAYYQDNLDLVLEELSKLDEEYEEAISSFSKKDLVISHEAFGYLAHDYGLNQIGIEALVPESEPSPDRMAQIIDTINSSDIDTIYYESNKNDSVMEAIQRETGAQILKLDTLEVISQEDLENGEDYFSLMRRNLDQLKKGLA